MPLKGRAFCPLDYITHNALCHIAVQPFLSNIWRHFLHRETAMAERGYSFSLTTFR